MQSSPLILLNNLCFTLADSPLFTDLNFTFDRCKTGLVGKNGSGKSSLLKLMVGELMPSQGSVQRLGSVKYCPQEVYYGPEVGVANVLGVGDLWDALVRLESNQAREHDFTLLESDWGFMARTQALLSEVGVGYLTLDRTMHSLSGGERTRVHLAQCFSEPVEMLVLDEPSNNLDAAAREYLYRAINAWQAGLVVVSHDRQLLSLMEQIVELNRFGLNVYGGNYADFRQQKTTLEAAKLQQLMDAKKAAHKASHSVQNSFERHEQRRAKGVELRRSGKIDKLSANSAQGRSERSQSRLLTQKLRMIQDAADHLERAKAQVEHYEPLDIALPSTYVPLGKQVVEIQGLQFAYSFQAPIIDGFNLAMHGPERVALLGANGSGKTTLLKLMTGQLQASQGSIKLGVRWRYLDQHASLLAPERSVLENFLRLNPDSTLQQAYAALAHFLFKNVAAQKQVKHLSGGEKLRAALACVLMNKDAPQLLILDEPTNHLDLDSVLSLESALQNYLGAMLVISHDAEFLQQIGVTKEISAPFLMQM